MCRWVQKKWYEEKYIVRMLERLFGESPLSQITNWQIEKWKTERRKEVGAATVNRQLTVIKHMFRKAVDWKMTTANPCAGVRSYRINSEQMRFLDVEEINALLDACNSQITSPWLLPLVTLVLNTGMRQGELLGLRWENVDQERGLIGLNRQRI